MKMEPTRRLAVVIGGALALATVAILMLLFTIKSGPTITKSLDSKGEEACREAVYLTRGGLDSYDAVRAQREKVEQLVSESGYIGFGSHPFITNILIQCRYNGYPVEVR